jgi:excisionase family DNA binding protein
LAEELNISVTLAYRHLADGSIPAIRLGNRYVVSRSPVEKWLSNAGEKEKNC